MIGNSVKYLFFAIVTGLVIGFILGWTVRRPVPVIVREPVTDTLRIPVPVPPDIVTIEYPAPEPVFIDTGGVRIDTVFVDSSRGVNRSEKYFQFPYAESWLIAYSAVPVDSFDHRLVIDWNGFVQERVAPEMGLRLRSERRIGRFQGFVAGVVATVGISYFFVK